jgi:hypothetical protein
MQLECLVVVVVGGAGVAELVVGVAEAGVGPGLLEEAGGAGGVVVGGRMGGKCFVGMSGGEFEFAEAVEGGGLAEVVFDAAVDGQCLLMVVEHTAAERRRRTNPCSPTWSYPTAPT